MNYDFDQYIDRAGTNAVKVEIMPEGSTKDTLSLWVADMDFACAKPIIDALHARIDRQILGYTDYAASDIRAVVKSWYSRRHGWDIPVSDMFFSPCVVTALAVLINALTEEGDGVILQKPVYYPFAMKVEENHRVVVNNALIRKDNTYVMDYEDLEQKFADPKNKGLILCSPHNPVGRVWTAEELRRLVDIAAKYDKWIISDEIHCDLTRKHITFSPLLKVAPEYAHRIITCISPSKTFNLAGMHFSTVVIPNPEYQKKWLTIAGGYSINGCSVLGLTAAIAAYTEGEEWLEQVREYLDENIRYIEQFVREQLPKAEMIVCEGTYLVWLDLRGYCSDPKKLERVMVYEAGLALDEGYIFGEEGIGYERINVASPKATIIECMQRMKRVLEDKSVI